MKDEIKDAIENQLDKTETNDETKSIEKIDYFTELQKDIKEK